MINFEWSFNTLMVKPIENDLQNVLYIVHWQLRGTTENGVFAEQRGSCSLPSPDPNNYIPFTSITKENVEYWVQTSMGFNAVDSIKKSIEEEIRFQTNPPFIQVTAPWLLGDLY